MLWEFSLVVVCLILEYGHAKAICTTRRCLAEMLIQKGFLSQPQNENCTQMIHVPFMEYQTLSVVSLRISFVPPFPPVGTLMIRNIVCMCRFMSMCVSKSVPTLSGKWA